MTIFTVHTENEEQVNALKAFMKTLKIKFEVGEETSYNPEFIKKIAEGEQQYKNGSYITVKKEELKEFLGL